MGVASSCRTFKPRCCTIPSAVVNPTTVLDVDVTIVVLVDAGAKLNAPVKIELEFQTATGRELDWINIVYSIDAMMSAMFDGQCRVMARSCRLR
jgi:hypothetical protein